MKISLSWLNDYIDVSEYFEKPEELSNILTHKGLEVEDIENKTKSFRNVVIGHILEKGKHPDADRLTLCQVSVGGGKVHQIVCGARNHNQGDRVVVALPGAILPGNFEIKLSKIRGVESQGMLCSKKELGLAEESEGILILPETAPIGESFSNYQGLDDIIFELKVTPNRADCLSHFGLAREISCVLNKSLKKNFKDLGTKKIATTNKGMDKEISVEVIDQDLCPRYTGRYIEGVQVSSSPDWLKKKIESIGLKSINNIVDITNFVMMELGQPLHAFDSELISGKSIIVSKAKEGEKFKTLDETEITLKGSELMIRDKEKSIALGGVVGGLNSGIRNETKNVFIESAFFLADSARKSARMHGIDTEAGYRFQRGVDPDFTFIALNRCAELILEVAGGTAFDNPFDSNPNVFKKEPIAIELSYVSERLGYDISKEHFKDWMKRLGASLKDLGNERFEVLAPNFRSDLNIKEDLIEEFARLEGYEHIPEKLPSVGIAPSPHEKQFVLNQKLNALLRAEGFSEAFNYAFVDKKGHKQFLNDRSALKDVGFEISSEFIEIKNPISEEMNVMRQLLSYGLLQNGLRNYRYGSQIGKIFEISETFDKKEKDYRQKWNLGMVRWGALESLWQKNKEEFLFFEMKSHIENLLEGLSVKSWDWESYDRISFLHPGQSVRLKAEGRHVGYLGSVHPEILDNEKARIPFVLAELNLELLMKGQPRVKRAKSISKNPQVERDIAFVMPEEIETFQVLKEIKKISGDVLKKIWVFDVFQGGSLNSGEKSVAYRMILQAEKTFEDKELLELDKKIIEGIRQKFKIDIR